VMPSVAVQLDVLVLACPVLRTLSVDVFPVGVRDCLGALRGHSTLTSLTLQGVRVGVADAHTLLTIDSLEVLRVAPVWQSRLPRMEASLSSERLTPEVLCLLVRHPRLHTIGDVVHAETALVAMSQARGPLAPLRCLAIRATHVAPTPDVVAAIGAWHTTLVDLSYAPCVLTAAVTEPRQMVDASAVAPLMCCAGLRRLALGAVSCDQRMVDLLAAHLSHLCVLRMEQGRLVSPLSFARLARLETLQLFGLGFNTADGARAPRDELVEVLTSARTLTELDIGGSFYDQSTQPRGRNLADDMSRWAVKELGPPCARLPLLVTLDFEFVCED